MKVDLLKLKETDMMSYGYVKASWLQKCVRRGLVDKAVSVANLYLQDNQKEGLRRKLLVFCYEDIGLGVPEMNLLLSKETDLLRQTEMLAKAPKNRENDRFLLAVRDFYPKLIKNSEIKEEVSVLHEICNLADTWFSNKRLKLNKVNVEQGFSFLKEISTSDGKEIIMQAEKDYFLLSKHNSFGARTSLAHIVLTSLRKINFSHWEIPQLNQAPIALSFVDDFALDKHTPFGKILGKTDKDWYKEGSVIHPEKLYPSLYLKNGAEKYPYELWTQNL